MHGIIKKVWRSVLKIMFKFVYKRKISIPVDIKNLMNLVAALMQHLESSVHFFLVFHWFEVSSLSCEFLLALHERPPVFYCQIPSSSAILVLIIV